MMEDMMGHGRKAPEPSKEAVEAAAKYVFAEDNGGDGLDTVSFFGWAMFLEDELPPYVERVTGEIRADLARALDAFRAAALTDEQRDVLTVWGWRKQHGGVFKDDYTMLRAPVEHEWYAFGMEEDGPDWLHAAATWVREQGTKGER